jgi:WD40 repeat protein
MHRVVSLSAGLLLGCATAYPSLPVAAPPDAGPHLVLQVGPRESVTGVAFSPDGQLLASSSADGRVRVYDARSGALLRAITAVPASGGRALAFSPDGKILASGGIEMDKTVKLWDPRTGALVRSLAGHVATAPGGIYAEVYAVAFSPDGRLLASAGRDHLVLVWDVETGAVRHRLAGHQDEVGSVAFSPDGRALASGGADRVVRLWDVATGRPLRTLAGHRDRVNALAFSPDGRMLASGSSDWTRLRGRDPLRLPGVGPGACEVKLWDTSTWGELQSLREAGRVAALTFAPAGQQLAGAIGGAVRFYDARTGRPDGAVSVHVGEVSSVAFAPDGRAFASGSHDRTVAVIALPDRALQRRLPGSWQQVNAVAVSPDGRWIAAGSSDLRFALGKLRSSDRALGPGGVRLWDATTGRLLRSLGEPSDQIHAVAASPDGRWVAGGGAGADGAGLVRLWDAESGAPAWAPADERAVVHAVAFAPDGRSLATAGADGVIRLRDVPTGDVRQTLKGHDGAVTALAFAADGTTLVSGGADRSARLWDVRTGQAVRVVRTEAGKPGAAPGKDERLITVVALSPDGGLLATCGTSESRNFGDRIVRLWDVRTGRLVHALERDQSAGRVVAFSPDGTTLACSGRGKAIALWDVRTGKMLREVPGHVHPANSVAFTPDGRALVSGGDCQTVMVRDHGSGRLRATLMTNTPGKDGAGSEDWLAITPEGHYDGSPGVDRLLAWWVGEELQTAERLAESRRRPDLLQESLRGAR